MEFFYSMVMACYTRSSFLNLFSSFHVMLPSFQIIIILLWCSCSTAFEAWGENSWGANSIQRFRFYKGWALHLWAAISVKYHSANCQHAHWYNWESMWTSWRRYLQGSTTADCQDLSLQFYIEFLSFYFVSTDMCFLGHVFYKKVSLTGLWSGNSANYSVSGVTVNINGDHGTWNLSLRGFHKIYQFFLKIRADPNLTHIWGMDGVFDNYMWT